MLIPTCVTSKVARQHCCPQLMKAHWLLVHGRDSILLTDFSHGKSCNLRCVLSQSFNRHDEASTWVLEFGLCPNSLCVGCLWTGLTLHFSIITFSLLQLIFYRKFDSFIMIDDAQSSTVPDITWHPVLHTSILIGLNYSVCGRAAHTSGVVLCLYPDGLNSIMQRGFLLGVCGREGQTSGVELDLPPDGLSVWLVGRDGHQLPTLLLSWWA